MSALQPSTSESHPPLAEAGTPARDRGPYAQPSPHQQAGNVDAVLIDAIRANRGPYVPAPWRMVTDEPTGSRAPVLPASSHTDESRLQVISTDAHVPSQGSEMWPTLLTAMSPASDVESAVEPSVESAPTELPWIDAFMDTPETGESSDATESVEFIAAPHAAPHAALEEAGEVAMEPPVEMAADATHEVVSEMHAAMDAASDTSAEAEWPLSEAGDAMRALADDLVAREATARDVVESNEITASVESTAESAEIRADAEPPFAQTPTLPMWGDDDLMNIMPVSRTPETGMPGHWAGAHQAEAPASSASAESTGGQAEHGNREAVALVLEALAQRTRNGELPIPGNASEMGDAAVLAATLATLLGARR